VRRPRLIATALAILLAAPAARLGAQVGGIRGSVVRADVPVGLADAEVELHPSGARTRTDARGGFVFRDLTPGQIELTVRRVGFDPGSVVVQVDAHTITEVGIRLEPVAALLDPVVTSATRDARSLSDVAAAVSVADTSALRRGRTIGLHETLRMMPGVQVSSRYGGMEDVRIGIRGSASRASQAVRGVAVLLDGIPLTESDGVTRLDLIELAASRQVEVVRGPVSALYAGSPGGVVNVVSRTGRDSRGMSARALHGAYGFEKYDGNAGSVLANGRASAFAAASYTSADGYRAHSDGSVLRGQVTLDYVPGPNTCVAIQANGSQLDLRLPGSLDQAQFDTAPDAASPAALMFGLGRVDNRFRAGARLEHTADNATTSGYLFHGGRAFVFPTATQILDANFHRIQGGARVRATGVAHSPLDAIIGLDYDNVYGADVRWNNKLGARDTLVYDGSFAVPNIGAYSQVEWASARATRVTLGLRYDRVTYSFERYFEDSISAQERTFDHLSPRLSALWSSGSGASLYASVGRGVEVPAINEISTSAGTLSQSLRPKSLWNYEFGGRRIVGNRLRLDGSVFYADVRGEFIPRTAAGVSKPENASHSRNFGIELSATARATRRIEIQAAYAFLDLRLRDYTSVVTGSTGAPDTVDFAGKLLPAVPRHRFTAEARVSPLTGLDVGAQVEWQSVVFVESGNADAGIFYVRQAGAPVQQVPFRAVPARALLHLDAAWRLGPATLFGSVENLFGLDYAGNVLANEASGRFYEGGPPASVTVGLSLTARATPDSQR
jgi:iron complex outermembrane receptor protein